MTNAAKDGVKRSNGPGGENVKLGTYKDLDGNRFYTLQVTPFDLACAPFTEFDHMLFRDVEENGGDRGTPIADWLLGLETMARRIEEAAQGEGTP